MKSFLFIANDGFTYDANNKEIENMQILGSANGIDINEAFRSFKICQPYLQDFTYKEIMALEFVGGFIRGIEL